MCEYFAIVRSGVLSFTDGDIKHKAYSSDLLLNSSYDCPEELYSHKLLYVVWGLPENALGFKMI